ncbi:putative beta-1,3-galactosyltransferase 12 [Canna indica]|uniref:Hexosyltransferase n=1 Tax=Canna indica TaxID=4628 RepID=A0AAQ3KSG1_9LILI|nr:putative beta-1,3-galactosyltransferase 12 [Canna indica]
MPQPYHSAAYDYDDDDDLLKKRRKPPPKTASAFLPSNSPLSSNCILIVLLLLSAVCLIVGISGIAFATAALRRPPRIVTVFRCGRAEDTLRTFRSKSLAAAGREDEGGAARPKVLGVVGVFTQFSAADRRAALRGTWFPSDSDALSRLDHATGLALRFVIGRTKDSKKMAALQKEIDMHHDFMFIDADEDNLKLPHKMLAFFKSAFNLFDAEFYVKADDDIYLRPDRLATLLAKDRAHHLTYIGCMKKGPVITDPNMKWYESSGNLIGNEYFWHAHGPIYALSADIVSFLTNARTNSLRMFNNEDVTIGSWMLAMNVSHEDNKALCEPICSSTSIAVWSNPRCLDPCDLKNKMTELHNISICSNSSTLPPEEEEDER